MLNPIHAIKQLYQLEQADSTAIGISRERVESHEKQLAIQLPPILYHYLIELGHAEFNTNYHQFVELPFERLGDYIVIGKTCDDDGVWGIHLDDLNQSNPMVKMSRNFDAIEQSKVHWFDELPLAEYLLAFALINGMNTSLAHHAQIYDFDGLTIPQDLTEKLAQLACEISELRQPHERYYQADDFSVVMLLGMDGSKPNAFMIGSQDAQKFEDFISQLAIGFEKQS